jgi:hypothetical protein
VGASSARRGGDGRGGDGPKAAAVARQAERLVVKRCGCGRGRGRGVSTSADERRLAVRGEAELRESSVRGPWLLKTLRPSWIGRGTMAACGRVLLGQRKRRRPRAGIRLCRHGGPGRALRNAARWRSPTRPRAGRHAKCARGAFLSWPQQRPGMPMSAVATVEWRTRRGALGP